MLLPGLNASGWLHAGATMNVVSCGGASPSRTCVVFSYRATEVFVTQTPTVDCQWAPSNMTRLGASSENCGRLENTVVWPRLFPRLSNWMSVANAAPPPDSQTRPPSAVYAESVLASPGPLIARSAVSGNAGFEPSA